MNASQERHVKSMARAVLVHVEGMERAMHALIREGLRPLPVELVAQKFEELESDWSSIQAVVSDMLPELSEE